MSSFATRPVRPLPVWLVWLGSLLAIGHLLAIGLLTLAADSGPWLMSNGQPSSAIGPHFATSVTAGYTVPYYLQPLRMTHNYHFESNKPVMLGIFFEVHLKNDAGEVIRTLKFPDDKANFWVRHRHNLLAQGLGNDRPVEQRGTERIPAPGATMPTVEVWDRADNETLRLKEVQEHLLSRDRPWERPSETAKVLAQSYLRYMCREHKATSAVLVRHHRPAILPMVLMMGPPPATDFVEYKSYFGEYRREQ